MLYFLPYWASVTSKLRVQNASRGQSRSVVKRVYSYWFFSSPFTALLVALSVSLTNPVYAATLDKNKLAAVISVINQYLISDEVSFPSDVELTLGQMESGPIPVRDRFDASFGAQAQGVEFCFVVSSNSAFQTGDLELSINGVVQSGSNRVVLGENCYTIPVSQQRAVNSLEFIVNGEPVNLSFVSVDPAVQSWLGLGSLTRSTWDESAVRKVLKVFAFGGHAFDSQILEWSYMQPRVAINEMLNFSEHNRKLSPLVGGERYTETRNSHGTLKGFYDYIGSDASDIPIPPDGPNGTVYREQLGYRGFYFASTFNRMVTMRGLNPFRQRIGFWETNYHLAVNRNAGVETRQAVHYYDQIMEAHEARLPYHEIMGIAAKSAAAAMQYGHRRNQWVFDEESDSFVCECNDDFAREIHQLYYGIFGINDPGHEDGTIRETSKMLTDMRVPYIGEGGVGYALDVTFGSDDHHSDDLVILGQTISGANASEKIDNLMPISMAHEETRQNLPIMIISVLADDNLNEARRNQLRAAWDQLGVNKDFLTYIHAYATSQMFHGDAQRKYATSFERMYYLANKFNLNNIEAFLGNRTYKPYTSRAGLNIDSALEADTAGEFFQPLHNVFGGQTSSEASVASAVFENNYNSSAERGGFEYYLNFPAECVDCDQGAPWRKDWSRVIPRRNGGYPADHVARWLWKHAVGNLDNYTVLERAHLLAILGAKRLPNSQQTETPTELDHWSPFFDLNTLLCMRDDRIESDGLTNNSLSALMAYGSWQEYCIFSHVNGGFTATERAALSRDFSSDDLLNSNADPFPYLRGLIDELAVAQVELTTTDPLQRRRANERVQAALAFIFATPFVFAEGE